MDDLYMYFYKWIKNVDIPIIPEYIAKIKSLIKFAVQRTLKTACYWLHIFLRTET